MTATQPWDPGRATSEIRSIARHPKLSLAYKLHARDRLFERGLILSDVLYALRFGNVHRSPVAATQPGQFRYLVECRTPNSGSRSIGVVVIPAKDDCLLKVVTVMWIDEYERVAGSIIGGNDID